ncbi:uncharacterized protein WM277_019368 [Molossus nigricans]
MRGKRRGIQKKRRLCEDEPDGSNVVTAKKPGNADSYQELEEEKKDSLLESPEENKTALEGEEKKRLKIQRREEIGVNPKKAELTWAKMVTVSHPAAQARHMRKAKLAPHRGAPLAANPWTSPTK